VQISDSRVQSDEETKMITIRGRRGRPKSSYLNNYSLVNPEGLSGTDKVGVYVNYQDQEYNIVDSPVPVGKGWMKRERSTLFGDGYNRYDAAKRAAEYMYGYGREARIVRRPNTNKYDIYYKQAKGV
jgi:hypothetical protein